MIICTDCKHGGLRQYCQSSHAATLPELSKKAIYSSCAFFEPTAREELRDEEAHCKEPELF